MTGLSRRGALAGIAGTLAAAACTRAAYAAPVSLSMRAAQAAWPSPPPLRPQDEGLAKLPQTSLWYQDTGGDGEPVVLCHPWTGSYAVWAYQQGPFAAAGYRVITYSGRGHYRSDPIDPAAPGTVTADLAALLDYLRIPAAHLVGSAGGALPALEFALDHPGRSLSVAVSSGHMGISDPEFLEIARQMFPSGVYRISHAFSELGPSYRAGNREGAAWEALEDIAWQGGTVRQSTESPITLARIASISAPLLLMTGGADLMIPPSLMRFVAHRAQANELVIVAEAGHSLYWEQPDAFNAAILDFIGRHSRPG
jgi:pimeloyl-ACP methyl ester carboxylesterase